MDYFAVGGRPFLSRFPPHIPGIFNPGRLIEQQQQQEQAAASMLSFDELGPAAFLALALAVAPAKGQASEDDPAPGPFRLTSKFTNENFRANFKAIQRKDIFWGPTNIRWVINFKAVDYAGIGCEDEDKGFLWHIHEKWLHEDATEAYGADCGGDFTGGHYDPTFGCGPASDNQGNGLCAAVGRGKDDGEAQTCDLAADSSTCEFGDLSGKVGRVMAEVGKQAFDDAYNTNLQNLELVRSIVFHCGDGSRVACAKLVSAAPRPTEPVLMSTSGLSLVRLG